MGDVKRYDPFGYDGLSAFMTEDNYGDYVRHDDYATLEDEIAKLRAELERLPVDGWKLVPVEPTEAMKIAGNNAGFWCVDTYRAMLAAAPSAPKADDPVKQMLLEALEKVDSEHEILGRMKTCELRRGRGSFGIAVMSDELALDWQSHQKNLERLIGLRHAAIAAARQEGGKV